MGGKSSLLRRIDAGEYQGFPLFDSYIPQEILESKGDTLTPLDAVLREHRRTQLRLLVEG
jgi:hypothetical protein